MRKIFKMVLVLSLCFCIKAQAQETNWTQKEKIQVEQEISWINEIVPLNEQQTEMLSAILLDKNQMIAIGTRVEWGKKIVLGRVEDILCYGEEVNRHPEAKDTHLVKEILSKEKFEEKIRNNKELLEKLNLNAIEN